MKHFNFGFPDYNANASQTLVFEDFWRAFSQIYLSQWDRTAIGCEREMETMALGRL